MPTSFTLSQIWSHSESSSTSYTIISLLLINFRSEYLYVNVLFQLSLAYCEPGSAPTQLDHPWKKLVQYFFYSLSVMFCLQVWPHTCNELPNRPQPDPAGWCRWAGACDWPVWIQVDSAEDGGRMGQGYAGLWVKLSMSPRKSGHCSAALSLQRCLGLSVCQVSCPGVSVFSFSVPFLLLGSDLKKESRGDNLLLNFKAASVSLC